MKAKSKEPNGAAGVAIREMELKDIQPVFELGGRLFTAEKWPTLYRCWDEHELVELFASDGKYCLVADAGDRVVGFALGSVLSKPRNAWRYGWLLWLGVAPRLKGRGVGKRLVNRLTELFIDNGARMMLVDTSAENHHAIEFFQRAGFGNVVNHLYLSHNLESHPRYIEKKAEHWDD